jgi:O-antigen/teichoic acid export membrane protein
MGVYGFYSVLGGLATLMIGNIDIIMLGSMVDLSSTAVYAIAYYMGTVIAVPQRSINKIAAPILADLFKSKNYPEIEALYQRTALNQLIAGSLLYVGIWANLHNVIDLLPGEYTGIYWVVVILGLAKLFDMATGINGHLIINSKHFRFDLYTNILLAVLTVITNFWLIPLYGLEGAAAATALSIFIYNFVKFIFVWIKFSMQPFQLNALWIIIIAGICLTLSELIPYMVNFFMDVTVRSLFILTLFTSTVLLFRLSDDFQNLANESLRRLKHLLTRN